MVSMLSVFVHAANELQVTYHINDASEAVTSTGTEGSLATLLGDNAMNVTQLSVKGFLNTLLSRLEIIGPEKARI